VHCEDKFIHRGVVLLFRRLVDEFFLFLVFALVLESEIEQCKTKITQKNATKVYNTDHENNGEGESTASYTFTHCVGYFACPGMDTQVQGIFSFTAHSKRSEARWSMTGIEPMMFGP
jgi:hypothetical protein